MSQAMFKQVLDSKGKKPKKVPAVPTDKKTTGKRETTSRIKKNRKQRRKDLKKAVRKQNLLKLKVPRAAWLHLYKQTKI